MASEPSLSDIDQLVTCPLCQEVYTNPVVLPKCPHVYCKACILGRFGDLDMLVCPMAGCKKKCKKSHLKPDERTEQLKELFKGRLKQKELMRTTEFACQLCDKKVATWACYDCNKYICDGTCADTHRTLKDLQDHTLTRIEDIKQQKVSLLKDLKAHLEPAEGVCVRKLTTITRTVQNIKEKLNSNIDKVQRSEEMWIEYIRKLHSDIIEDIRSKTDELLESFSYKEQQVSSFKESVSEEMKSYESLICENKTHDLLNDKVFNKHIENGKSYRQQLDTIKHLDLSKSVPCFSEMDSTKMNHTLDYISQKVKDQIAETKSETPTSGVKRKSSTKRRPPALLQKSADSLHLCSLKSLSKDKHITSKNLYKFDSDRSPKRIKSIDDELFVVLKGGTIRIITVIDSVATSRDVIVHRMHDSKRGEEYYAQAVAGVKTGIVVAIGRAMINPSMQVSKEAGLALVDNKGTIKVDIEKGSFIDVFHDSGMVYGLTDPHSNPAAQEVQVFNHHRYKWSHVRTVSLGDKASRLIVLSPECFYTSHSSNAVQKYEVHPDGSSEQSEITKRKQTASVSAVDHAHFLSQPERSNTNQSEQGSSATSQNAMLCFADPQGNLFVVDYMGNGLHCITTRHHFRGFNPNVHFQGPWDADMDCDGNIWLLARGEDNAFSLFKIYTNQPR